MTTMRRILALSAVWLFACDPEAIEHETGETGETDDAEQTFPTRMAEAYCAALFACEPVTTCTDWSIPYASEADCVTGERAALEEVSVAARGEGMTFDGECVERWIAQYTEIGCDGDIQVKVRYGESYGPVGCQPYYGTVPEGEDPCVDIVGADLSNCGADLECFESTCVALDTSGCECPEGSRCDLGGSDHSCKPVLAIGDVCMLPDFTRPGVCPLDANCGVETDDEGTLVSAVCAPLLPIDAICTSNNECASLVCEDAGCVPASPWLCSQYVAPRRFR